MNYIIDIFTDELNPYVIPWAKNPHVMLIFSINYIAYELHTD